jgi:modulator of FtsH protease
MQRSNVILEGAKSKSIEVNRVLRNTYTLLSMTLLLSGVTAGLSALFKLPHPGIIITLVGYFGLLFLTNKFRNSFVGLVCVFALTGFMGYTLGPIINHYLNMSSGGQIVMNALAGTGLIFLGLSGYALTSRKDFSFLGGFIFVGVLTAFLAGLVAVFFNISALSLAVSAAFVLLMSALILYQTSQIVHGGESNYIMATVTLYVSIFNLFTSLMHLLGFMSSED